MKNKNNENDFFEEYIESNSSKHQFARGDFTNDLTYSSDEVEEVWIYPLTTLTGKKIKNGIRMSVEKITLMSTIPKIGKKVKVYINEKEDFDLIENVDPINPIEQLMKRAKTLDLITNDLRDVDYDFLYMLTKVELTEYNVNEIDKYLSKNITPPGKGSDYYEMSFSSLEDFSSSFNTSPIKIIVTKPILNKIKEIHVTTPPGTLVGNIKVVDENGRFPDLLANKDTEIFPKLMFPFQTQPVLNLVDYWSSDQIIPLKDITDYLDKNNLDYDQEFSLAEFISLGSTSGEEATNFQHVKEINWLETGLRDSGNWLKNHQSGYYWSPNSPTHHTERKIFKLKAKKIYSTSISPDKTRTQDLYQTISAIDDVNIITTSDYIKSSSYDAICSMLTETFWKDYEFQGATNYDVNNNLVVNDKTIYQLMEKYAGQDRYSVTTNIWLSWKKINSLIVNKVENQYLIKRIESVIAMLSGSIKSNFSINKGDNDDYKVLLPYYFELQNQIDNPKEWVKYTNIRVKLKSNYFSFNKKKVESVEKNVSSNKIHKLEYNHYAFPEMTKIPETASIPSSMPLDQQTANGEYSKYQLKVFTNILETKNIIKKHYGSGIINFNPLNNIFSVNVGTFEFKNPVNINEIKLSSFFGYGNWRISLIDEKFVTYKIDLKIFDKSDSTISFVNLIL